MQLHHMYSGRSKHIGICASPLCSVGLDTPAPLFESPQSWFLLKDASRRPGGRVGNWYPSVMCTVICPVSKLPRSSRVWNTSGDFHAARWQSSPETGLEHTMLSPIAMLQTELGWANRTLPRCELSTVGFGT